MRVSGGLLVSASALAVLALAAPAQALSSRAWVSGHGTDSASCGSPATPCRSLQYTHDHIVAPSGEIDILDPAGYGAITITKPLSIVNDGVGTAGVQQSVAGQNAITINIGSGAGVTLRGLNIDGLGAAHNGIEVDADAGALVIVNCVVRHFTGDGIHIAPSANGYGASVVVADTLASDNGGGGIVFLPSAGSAAVVGGISRTLVANNGGAGVRIDASGPGGSGALATVVDSVAVNNAIGFQSNQTGATLRLSRSLATRNGTGVLVSSGAAASSYGDNEIDGNISADVSGSLPVIPKQ